MNLRVKPLLVRDVHPDVLHPDRIERIVGERQVVGAAPVHFDQVVKARQAIQQFRAGAEIGRQFDAIDTAAERGGEQPGRAGQPGANSCM